MGKLLSSFKKDPIDNFILSISTNTNIYYVFTAHPSPFLDDNNPPGVLESYQESVYTPMSQMLFGKRLANTNIGYMVPRYNWVSNTVYTQYDHTNINLNSQNFFVFTDTNNVYKCLFNNRGAASTSKPTLTQNNVFTTADGYIWKYMFTVSPTDFGHFATSNYIPVTVNAAIQTSARSGLDVIDIIAGGGNYLTSTNGVIRSVVNATCLQIDTNASINNDFYDGSALYITTGSQAGSVRTIQQYFVNTSGNFVTLDATISGITPITTSYEINPKVNIVGDGTGANAICRVSNGVVSSVVILAAGNNYTHANVTVTANATFGTGANLIAYIPPHGGHGANPIQELVCNTMGIYIDFINTESNTITTACSFRSVGIVKNPMTSANVNLPLSATTFSQLLVTSTSPALTFGANNVLRGATSGARGTVVASNTTSTSMVGDKTFTVGETVTEYFANGVATGQTANLSVISTVGASAPGSGDLIYLNNITPVQRSNTNTDTVKILISI